MVQAWQSLLQPSSRLNPSTEHVRIITLNQLLFPIALFVTAIVTWPCVAEDTVFFVVRNAERENATSDSPLSAPGVKRSQQLMQTLEHLKVSAIYSTDYVRTKDTAKPLAEKLGINTETYAQPTDAWLGQILESQKGNRVLIVGHSNTVHLIVNRLTGQGLTELADGEYDNLFIVVVSGDKKSVVRLDYGAATP